MYKNCSFYFHRNEGIDITSLCCYKFTNDIIVYDNVSQACTEEVKNKINMSAVNPVIREKLKINFVWTHCIISYQNK